MVYYALFVDSVFALASASLCMPAAPLLSRLALTVLTYLIDMYLSLSLSLYIYIYIYMYHYIHIYIYIYIYIYTYMHIYIYRERERKRYIDR